MSETICKGDYVEILSNDMCGYVKEVRDGEASVGGHPFDVCWRPFSILRLVARKDPLMTHPSGQQDMSDE